MAQFGNGFESNGQTSGQVSTAISAALVPYSTTTQMNAAILAARAQPVVPFKSASFDVVAGTTAAIGTTGASSGKFAINLYRAVCLTEDTVAVPAVLSIGTNAPDYNNLVATWTLTGLDAVDQYVQAAVTDLSLVAAGTAIVAKLVTPATAVAQTVSIQLVGDYQGV